MIGISIQLVLSVQSVPSNLGKEITCVLQVYTYLYMYIIIYLNHASIINKSFFIIIVVLNTTFLNVLKMF